MEIKFNKAGSILASTVIIIIYTLGFPIAYFLFNLTSDKSHLELSNNMLLFTNIGLIGKHSGGLIMGIWMYLNGDKLNLNKSTAAIIGLILGQFILAFIAARLYFQTEAIKYNKFKLVLKTLILTVIAYIISVVSNQLLTPYLALVTDTSTYGFFIEYSAYFTLVSYALMLLLSLVLFINLKIRRKRKNAAQ